MYAGLHTFVDGERITEFSCPARGYNSRFRENRAQEIDDYIAEGKIPIEVDLSQHPEKSIEARACVSFTLPSVCMFVNLTLLIGLMGVTAATINDIKTAQEM